MRPPKHLQTCSHIWGLHCFKECVDSHWCCAQWRDVCVFLLCHSDDAALASRRTGASVQLSLSMLDLPCPSRLPRTSGPRGLLGSGISQCEETAEACVASALANQHSHHTHIHARRPNLCSPTIISSTLFFSICRGQTPTKARVHKSQRGLRGGGRGQRQN